eukprot:jgi/Psemu1/33821/gm1.33821_g
MARTDDSCGSQQYVYVIERRWYPESRKNDDGDERRLLLIVVETLGSMPQNDPMVRLEDAAIAYSVHQSNGTPTKLARLYTGFTIKGGGQGSGWVSG